MIATQLRILLYVLNCVCCVLLGGFSLPSIHYYYYVLETEMSLLNSPSSLITTSLPGNALQCRVAVLPAMRCDCVIRTKHCANATPLRLIS